MIPRFHDSTIGSNAVGSVERFEQPRRRERELTWHYRPADICTPLVLARAPTHRGLFPSMLFTRSRRSVRQRFSSTAVSASASISQNYRQPTDSPRVAPFSFQDFSFRLSRVRNLEEDTLAIPSQLWLCYLFRYFLLLLSVSILLPYRISPSSPSLFPSSRLVKAQEINQRIKALRPIARVKGRRRSRIKRE